MVTYYGLTEENVPVPLEGVIAWVRWHETHREQADVGYATWKDVYGQHVEVSTRFLGTHFLMLECLWETMVFLSGVPECAYQTRYTTFDAACAGHVDTVLRVLSRYPEEEEGERKR